MSPRDVFERLLRRPALVGALSGAVVLALLVTFLTGSASSLPVTTDPSTLAAVELPLPPAPPASEVIASGTTSEGSPTSEDSPAPVTSPGTGKPVEVEVPEGPVVNDRSLPMEDSYVPESAPVEEVEIAQPVGSLYQRQSTGGYVTDSFVPVGSLPSDAAVVEVIRATFPEAEWSRAERIAGCESGMRSVSSKPNSNGSRDHGIFQLNDGGTLQGLLRSTGQDPSNVSLALDPAWNVKAAKVLWEQRGWQPWTCASKLGIVDGLWSSTPGPNW